MTLVCQIPAADARTLRLLIIIIMLLITIDNSKHRTTAASKIHIESVSVRENTIVPELLIIGDGQPGQYKMVTHIASSRYSQCLDCFQLGLETGMLSVVKPLDFEKIQECKLLISYQPSVEGTGAYYYHVTVHVLNTFDTLPTVSWTVMEPQTSRVYDEKSVLEIEVIRNLTNGSVLATLMLTPLDIYPNVVVKVNNTATSTYLRLMEIMSGLTYAVVTSKPVVDDLINRKTQLHNMYIVIGDNDTFQPLCSFHLRINAWITSTTDSTRIKQYTLSSTPSIYSTEQSTDHNTVDSDDSTSTFEPQSILRSDSALLHSYPEQIAATLSSAPSNTMASVQFTGFAVHHFTVMENEQPSLIGVVGITFASCSSNRIEYFIDNPVYRKSFSLVQSSGRLYSKHSFDHEETDSFSFEVYAICYGERQTTRLNAQVYVTVLDQNDNNPVFIRPAANQTVEVERAHVTGCVTPVHALDDDQGENGRISVSMEHHWYFNIQSDCIYNLGAPKGSFVVSLVAFDHGEERRFTYMEVKILVALTGREKELPSASSFLITSLQSQWMHLAGVIAIGISIVTLLLTLVCCLSCKKPDKLDDGAVNDKATSVPRNMLVAMSSATSSVVGYMEDSEENCNNSNFSGRTVVTSLNQDFEEIGRYLSPLQCAVSRPSAPSDTKCYTVV